MKQTLTKLWDKEKKVFIEKWLTKEQFENLSFRYCLPYEMKEEDLRGLKNDNR